MVGQMTILWAILPPIHRYSMKKTTLFTFILAFVAGPALAQSDVKSQALEHAEAVQDNVSDMANSLWDYAEIGLHEHKSAAKLIEHLEEEGFSIERGVAGMPTAFVATYGSGEPVIGILAEYDALPGVGNDTEPMRQTREDGVLSGHGCGHNLFGAASVGGAMALKRTMESEGLSGTIKLFGTPAEETLIGKVYMAKAGVFEGLDAVLDWHPGTANRVGNSPSRAMNNFQVEFFGQAAHSSSDPWNGRSALDAVEMMNYGVNLMREHVKPTARIHYVIPNAGQAPNVVPEYAKVWYYVRDVNRESVQTYYERILDIAAGAALATRTEHKVYLITGVHDYNLNRPLQEAVQANLERLGPPQFTETEQEFGKRLQRFLEVEESGFSTEIAPLADGPQGIGGGSTDVAEVSYLAPTVAFSIATAAEHVPWHSWATTACHGMSAGVRGAHLATRLLTLTGVDLLTDADLRARAKAFFLEKTEGRPYVSPIPLDQKPPLPEGE